MRKIKPPNFETWKAWRHYHRAVWRRVWQTQKTDTLLLPVYLAGTAISDIWWLRLMWIAMGLTFAYRIFARAGRSYTELDIHLIAQIRKQKFLTHMREHMLEDGMTTEEADMALLELDISMDGIVHGD